MKLIVGILLWLLLSSNPFASRAGTSIATKSAPAGTNFMVAGCKDETTQTNMGPSRTQSAVIWVSVSRDVLAPLERAPSQTVLSKLAEPAVANLTSIASEAIKLAAESCGIKYSTPAKPLSRNQVAVIVFPDRLPAGGPLRPNEEPWGRDAEGDRMAASLHTTDGVKFDVFNSLSPENLSQRKASIAARDGMAAAQVAKQDQKIKMDSFFAKYGVAGYVNADALNRNPFSFEGKNVVMQARLQHMLDAKRALLTTQNGALVVLSDIPRDMFANEGAYIVVGKVLGNTQFEGNQRQKPVPHIGYVYVKGCGATSCF